MKQSPLVKIGSNSGTSVGVDLPALCDRAVWTGTHLAEAPALSPTDLRHIMCAVNFGPQSIKTMRWAADFASEFGAKLTVVDAVLETPPNPPERYMFPWHAEARCGANEQLRTLY